jgi:cytochrome c oxidase cbb3-type subunit 4
VDIGIIRGLLTAAVMLLFIGIFAWSFSRRRKTEFDRLANMPLEDDRKPPAPDSNKEQTP